MDRFVQKRASASQPTTSAPERSEARKKARTDASSGDGDMGAGHKETKGAASSSAVCLCKALSQFSLQLTKNAIEII